MRLFFVIFKHCVSPNSEKVSNWKRRVRCKVVISLKPDSEKIFLVIFADILFYGQQHPYPKLGFLYKKRFYCWHCHPTLLFPSSFTFICHVCDVSWVFGHKTLRFAQLLTHKGSIPIRRDPAIFCCAKILNSLRV